MALGKRLINTGAAVAACSTDSVQAFGADSAFSSNIALYQLDGNADDTTTNYNGTASNVTYASGHIGNAAVFNGSSSYIQASNPLSNIEGNQSVSFWLNLNSQQGGGGVGQGGLIQLNGKFYLQYSSGISGLRVNNWKSGKSFYDTSSTTNNSERFQYGLLNSSQWYHIVFVKNGTDSDDFVLYIDGQAQSQPSGTTQSSGGFNGIQGTVLGTIGATGGTTYNYLDGKLDQVRIFDKAISSEDVATLYAETTSTASDTNPLSEGSGVALYSLDYDASEASGYFNATSTDVEFGVGGKINYGARFNGSSSKIEINSNLNIANNSFSFSFWIACTDSTNDNYVIITEGATSPPANKNLHIGRIASYPVGKMRFGFYANDLDSTTNVSTDGTWQHWVCTFDASSTTQKIYLNGNLESTRVASSNFTGTSNLQIGGLTDWASNNEFNGSIDQVRVFSKALNQTEVDTLYAETACVYECTTDDVNYPFSDGTNVEAYYKLDNSSEDYVGGNDGSDTDIEYRFGRYGQAAVFDGSGSKIVTTLNANGFSQIAISCWINTSLSSGSGSGHIVSANDASNWCFLSILKSTGIVTFGASNGGSSIFSATHTGAINDGNWHHVAGSYNGTNATLYIDGTGYTPVGATQSLSVNTAFGIGYRNTAGSTGTYFNGSIDQVRIYSTALDSDQVTQLYEEKPCEDTSNFKTVLYDGNGSSDYISNVGFQPDLVWVKNRGKVTNHNLFDSIRGNKRLIITTSAETNLIPYEPAGLPSFEENGFYIGDNYNGDYGLNGNPSGTYGSSSGYVAWNWKAGGDDVLNEQGSIDSQVSANTEAGFSIVKYTGNNSVSATVGHGLTDAEMIILKDLDDGTNHWRVWHKDLTSGSWLYLALTNAQASAATDGGLRNVDSNTFGFLNGTTAGVEGVNSSASNYIAYCWHSVAGYSKIGTYEGTNSTVTVSDVGFKPSFVMIKNIDDSADWVMLDNRRNTIDDRLNNWLRANSDVIETGAVGTAYITVNDNGFIVANTTSLGTNSNGDTYIYMAFK